MCRVFHKWDKWSKPISMIKTINIPARRINTEIPVEVQERHCLNCNMIQRRDAK